MKSFTRIKKALAPAVSAPSALFSRTKVKLGLVRIDHSVKVNANGISVPEPALIPDALTTETPMPIARQIEEVVAVDIAQACPPTDSQPLTLSSTPASLSWRSRRHHRVDCFISHHRISADNFEAKKVDKANSRHAHLESNSSFYSCQSRREKAEIDYHNEEKTSLTVLTPVLQSRQLTTIAEEDETSACPVKCEHEQMLSALPSRDKANLPFTPRGAEMLNFSASFSSSSSWTAAFTASSVLESPFMPRMTTRFCWSDIRTNKELWISTGTSSKDLQYPSPALIVTSPSTETVSDDVQVLDLFHELLAIHATLPSTPALASVPASISLHSFETIPVESDEAEATLAPSLSSANDLFAQLKKAIDANNLGDYHALLDSLIF